MSKNKSAETAVFTLHGYIKNKIARLIGFHERTLPVSWKHILFSCWLKTDIALHDLRTFLIGSKTDDALCFKRWVWLGDQIGDHKTKEPTKPSYEYTDWFDQLIELRVEREMAWFEMMYHRTGKTQHSWNRNDMSAEDVAELPKWWFDGTRAKRKLREINDN